MTTEPNGQPGCKALMETAREPTLPTAASPSRTSLTLLLGLGALESAIVGDSLAVLRVVCCREIQSKSQGLRDAWCRGDGLCVACVFLGRWDRK